MIIWCALGEGGGGEGPLSSIVWGDCHVTPRPKRSPQPIAACAHGLRIPSTPTMVWTVHPHSGMDGHMMVSYFTYVKGILMHTIISIVYCTYITNAPNTYRAVIRCNPHVVVAQQQVLHDECIALQFWLLDSFQFLSLWFMIFDIRDT